MRRKLTTAWSLRPMDESLEKFEQASGTLKKAKLKTEEGGGTHPETHCEDNAWA